MEIEFGKMGSGMYEFGRIRLFWGVNGVVMDRYGLILWENDATGSGKAFRYLPGLQDAI